MLSITVPVSRPLRASYAVAVWAEHAINATKAATQTHNIHNAKCFEVMF